MTIFQSYCGFLANAVEIGSIFYFILFTGLIIQDFRYSEMVYAFVFEEGFNRSEAHIELALGYIKNFVNQNFATVLNSIKLTLSSIFVLAIDMLPQSVKPYTDYLFTPIKNYRQKALDEWTLANQSQTDSEVTGKDQSAVDLADINVKVAENLEDSSILAQD